jgi:hypothetical protein
VHLDDARYEHPEHWVLVPQPVSAELLARRPELRDGCLPVHGEPHKLVHAPLIVEARRVAKRADPHEPIELLGGVFSVSAEALDALRRAVRAEGLRGFFSARFDASSRTGARGARHAASTARAVAGRTIASRAFATRVARTIAAGHAPAPAPALVSYAREVAELACEVVQRTPDCAMLFGDVCAPVNGDARHRPDGTPARAALARALRARHMRAVEWTTHAELIAHLQNAGGPREYEPLVFPPHADFESEWASPCVLVQFARA